MIGAGLNLFWGHLHYFSGGIWTFPLLSATYASAPIAERAILQHFYSFYSNFDPPNTDTLKQVVVNPHLGYDHEFLRTNP